MDGGDDLTLWHVPDDVRVGLGRAGSYSDRRYSDMSLSMMEAYAYIMLMSSSLVKRTIERNRLVCIGGVKIAGFGRVSFDAIIHAAITPTDNKGRLELSRHASQF